MKYTNILFIDDDEEDLQIFQAALEQISTTIKYNYYTDARKALEQLRLGSVTTQAIFLDLNMPSMNGHEFLAQLKQEEKLKDIPVIIFTTSSDSSIREMTLSMGAIDFLTKPNDFKDLIALLTPFIF
ncbi:response regulator [Flavobacterium sp. FlaQc-47]|uniref:response regulator n=1 Tax=Flavobacterium sp. FlaQc-47 TaxID=3374180 RepID=UPI0037565226